MSTFSSIEVVFTTREIRVKDVLSALATVGWASGINGASRYVISANDEFDWLTSTDDFVQVTTLLDHEFGRGNFVGLTLRWDASDTLVDVLFHQAPHMTISLVLAGERKLLKGSLSCSDISWYLERLLNPIERLTQARARIASITWDEYA